MPIRVTRRAVLQSALAATAAPGASIDRRALVSRHNPVIRALDPLAPLSVGNGRFAFTVDITGLQTFASAYEAGLPLCTQSYWGWHSFPPVAGDLRLSQYDTYGRKVGYPTSAEGQKELYNWLRENPHRLNLGRIGFDLEDVRDTEQTLDLWTGILTSRFRAGGKPVTVRTCCHPDSDTVAVEVDSPLDVVFEFPYGSPGIAASDWKRTDAHTTTVLSPTELERRLDATTYFVSVDRNLERTGPHRFVLRSARAFRCRFSQKRESPPPNAFAASEKHWREFWSGGGAVELAGSTDPRAGELERRVVLSQYLTAIQSAGPMPPQETGLTCNSWYGKFHLEMHWWHTVHFACWRRMPLFETSVDWYTSILPSAREWARRQGYRGARWPKMVGPEGRDSPSPIGPLLIWQQPHPLYYAELCYRARPDRRTLERFRPVVFETADFMASFAHWDGRRFVLGPPVIPAQENHRPSETWNPAYEIEYWRWGLGVAQRWRERLGMPRDPEWDRVRTGLSPLPAREGVYLAHENCPNTFTEKNSDHPSMLAALGVLPGEGVDRETMRRTLHTVMKVWKWDEAWGWDFPMTAMTAARLGERQTAVDALLIESPKNRYLPNGHNWQRKNLPLYLPGNGGLLAAVAMMAHGSAFPAGWTVRWEKLDPLL